MDDNNLLEPLSLFNKELKKAFHENAENYFEELVTASKIDVEANKQTVKEYKNTCNLLEAAKKKLNKSKALKGFLIFLVVILFITAGLFIYFSIENIILELYQTILIAAVSLAIAILLIIYISKTLKKRIKKEQESVKILEDKAAQLLAEAYAQMAALNALFDWNMHVELFKRTTPLIEVDKYFDVEKFNYMHHKYGLNDETDPTISTESILSGSIVGNPFLLVRQLKQTWGQHTYHGSLTISWTETVRDSDGHLRTVTRTQTLHASVVKPIPLYNYHTFLVYGNDAAPELSFSRKPSGASGKTDKEIDRIVRKGEKKIEDMAKDALMSGKRSFTKLGNAEFEVLFGALDRDNDVEFRLLFTPLAQKGLLDLIRNPVPYGDDFEFIKQGPINYIISNHSQKHDYYGNPANYYSYDYEASKKAFVTYNDNFFQGLYFDLAPLLCVPLYQQYEPDEHIFQHTYERNYTSYESEVLANSFDVNLFRHQDAITSTILKSNFAGKCGRADKLSISAYSYGGIARTDYISVYGGDGRYHQVPVHWTEYYPVQTETMMGVREYEGTKKDYDELNQNSGFQTFLGRYVKNQNMLYQRGLLAFLMNTYYDDSQEEELSKILTKDKK